MNLLKISLIGFFTALPLPFLSAEQWSVPLAGNAYRSAPATGGQGFQRGGTLAWNEKEAVYSVYFHLDRPAELSLALKGKTTEGESQVKISAHTQSASIDFSEQEEIQGTLKLRVPAAGYVRVDLQGAKPAKDGSYGILSDLIVHSETPDLALNYVKTDEGRMFYWGRRGPSVHLRYPLPKDKKITHAYSEIFVPEGQDPIGSYYMANGFGEGYFGIQVNSPTERRVLFSVWSPFKTDNPTEIPESDQIRALASGEGVTVKEFGNEGSGGQSFLVYPWETGKTYRFLTEVKPNGDNTTTYTAWFGDKAKDEWRLIASFKRPKTDTYYRGFHSFLENFSPTHGHLTRSSLHGNQWARDNENKWHELTSARFSVDPTGGGGHRLDFAGGKSGSGFFMKNGGFFNETTKAGTEFERPANPKNKPQIDFEKLPQK